MKNIEEKEPTQFNDFDSMSSWLEMKENGQGPYT